MLYISTLESTKKSATSLFGKFSILTLKKGQGITVGNALRRTLLSNLPGLAITAVKIHGIEHEFSSIFGIKEDVVEILLNLKQIIIKGPNGGEMPISSLTARLAYTGPPGILTAGDLDLPVEYTIVEPKQHIATIIHNISLDMEFIIERGEGYVLNRQLESMRPSPYPPKFLTIDAVFMPVKKVNFFVESISMKYQPDKERLVLEITTDGSIQPLYALEFASQTLTQIFNQLYEDRTKLLDNT